MGGIDTEKITRAPRGKPGVGEDARLGIHLVGRAKKGGWMGMDGDGWINRDNNQSRQFRFRAPSCITIPEIDKW